MKTEEFLEQIKSYIPADQMGSFLSQSETLPMPSRKLESWKYFPTKFLSFEKQEKSKSFDLAKEVSRLQASGMEVLVTKNGQIQKDLSTDKVQSTNLKASDFSLENLETKLDALSIYSEGQKVAVEMQDSKSLQIIHFIDSDKSFFNFKLSIEEATEVELYENFVAAANVQAHFVSEVELAKDAKLKYYSQSELSSSSQVYTHSIVNLKEAALFKSVVSDTDPGKFRRKVKVNLDGEAAHADMKAFYLLNEEAIVNHKIDVNHNVPNATSEQLYKGILDGESKAIFDGLVYVAKQAMGTDSQQLNKSMLFADSAEVITRPQLEIYADDVACAHGATLGGFNRDEVFYFQSRAIPEDVALRMLAVGYAEEIFQEVENKEIHKDFLDQFLDRFTQYKVDIHEL
ncbi:MAG: SufD family Fe-S cluster assembly protein [Bdellovibrionota bacterium]|nr:SufD family Fe-S cluster assembly protein [Bdellovibrionota bacterium]